MVILIFKSKIFLNKIKKKIRSLIILIRSLLQKKNIIFLNKYNKYADYLEHQKNKTMNPSKIKLWKGEEWEIKYIGFLEIFNRNKKYIANKNNAICLGARTGQEVKALIDLEIDAVGIDLVPFPPYTLEGDIHNIEKPSNSVELLFTNIMDHSLYPKKFCLEMERICRSKGHIIIHLQKGIDGDLYSENMIRDPKLIIEYFKFCKVCESRSIRNSFDMMNWEIILEKI